MKKNQFTMMEMLVIAVVSVVAVTLMTSAFAEALGDAKKTGCEDNMRKISAATMAFVAENDGYLPSLFSKDRKKGWQGGNPNDGLLAPYLKVDSPYGFDFVKESTRGSLACPAQEPDGARAIFTYAPNQHTYSWLSTNPKLDQYKRPDRVCIVSELDQANTQTDGYCVRENPLNSPNGIATMRHGGCAGVIYADGHFEWLTDAEIPVGNPYVVFWNPGNLKAQVKNNL